MSTVSTVPVRNRTITDSLREKEHLAAGRRGAERWFILSRLALIVVALVIAVPHPVAAWWGGRSEGPVALGLAIGVVWAALSWVVRYIERHRESSRDVDSGIALTLDVLGLTALLSTSGAAQNPFTLLYFVPITLATVVAQKWTFRIAGLSVAGFALLVFQTSNALEGHRNHAHHAHFFHHVQGMALALAVAGAFVTCFVHRIARALAAQQRRITQLSQEKQRDQYAIALGALSAGAAHELGSPLGSVQLLAEELPHLQGTERDRALETIVNEVQRMKTIVHGMDSSQLSAEILGEGTSWHLVELKSLAESIGVKASVPERMTCTQPQKIIAQIVRELLRNALNVVDASQVRLEVAEQGGCFAVLVVDEGPGLTPEQLEVAQEPFVSHSGGTGLGLFLASVHARQLGGRLALSSRPGAGTRVTLELPVSPPSFVEVNVS